MDKRNTMQQNNCTNNTDLAQRFLITFWVLLLYILTSSKFMYGITNSIGLRTINHNSPTFSGYMVHALIFGMLVFFSTYMSLPNI